MTNEQIDDVRKLIASDVAYDKPKTPLNISKTRLDLYLHYHLKVKNICSRHMTQNLF